MSNRYFVDSPIAGELARLRGTEAHHLAHVMRAKPGDEVVLFDGGGAEFTARVEHVGRSEIDLVVLARHEVNRESRTPVTLGVALPKSDRGRMLVEKAVELGVARLVPLVTEHSVDRQSPSALDRMRRAVIEASKQCGRNRLLEITTPQRLAEYATTVRPGAVCLLAHPGAPDCRRVLDEAISDTPPPAEILLAIGPEGGFADEEVEAAADHGWRAIGLGPRILRVETAALALVAILMSRLEGTEVAGG